MGSLEDLGAVPPKEVWPGIVARIVQGERITMAVVELGPGGHVPGHRHEYEQLGLVLAGSLEFTVADETRTLGPGGTWRIPAGVPHEVKAGPEGAVALDVFSPPRDDWEAIEASPPRNPRWPG